MISITISFQVDLETGKENSICMLEAHMVEKPSSYVFFFRDKIVRV